MTTYVASVKIKKPSEYKEYVNFLDAYRNGKKEDFASLSSVDSGVSVKNSTSSHSRRSSVSSQSSDVSDYTKSTCSSYSDYLENYGNRRFSSIKYQTSNNSGSSEDGKQSQENNQEKKTVKTEVFIEIKNPESKVAEISKTFQKVDLENRCTENIETKNDNLSQKVKVIRSSFNDGMKDDKNAQNIENIHRNTVVNRTSSVKNRIHSFENKQKPDVVDSSPIGKKFLKTGGESTKFQRLQRLLSNSLSEDNKNQQISEPVNNERQMTDCNPKQPMINQKVVLEVNYKPPLMKKPLDNNCSVRSPSPVKASNTPNFKVTTPLFTTNSQNDKLATVTCVTPPPPPPPMMPPSFFTPKTNNINKTKVEAAQILVKSLSCVNSTPNAETLKATVPIVVNKDVCHKSQSSVTNGVPPPPPPMMPASFTSKPPLRPDMSPLKKVNSFNKSDVVQNGPVSYSASTLPRNSDSQIKNPTMTNGVPPPPPPMMPANFTTKPPLRPEMSSVKKVNSFNKTDVAQKGPICYSASTLPRNSKLPDRISITTAVPLNEAQKKEVIRKVAYSKLRGLYGAYHDQANDYVSTLPRHMVKKENGLQNIIDSIASQGGLEKLNGRVNPNPETE